MILAAGCGRAKPAARHYEVGWRPVAAFAGKGSELTESFNIESGQWRIHWKAAGTGHLRVTVESAVSGRPLLVAVDRAAPGSGVAYVNEDPRLCQLVIDSADVDWSVDIQEAVVGDIVPDSGAD